MLNLIEHFEDKTILITGALGSIGSEILRQIIQYNPKQIIAFDNRETEMFYKKEFYQTHRKIEFVLGDVRDFDRVSQVMKGVNIVFHAAALKNVLVCENNPFETVQTNILGTQNIIKAVLQNNVEMMTLISTDKAVNPINVMGSTKLVAERLVSSMCLYRGQKKSKFGVVRFGNVLSSRGSVLEIWKNQLEDGQKITITNPEMSRFFMSIPESVKLIFNASYYAENGEIFILKMPSLKIGDLAQAFLEVNNLPSDHYRTIGSGPGEKIYEDLIYNPGSLLMENESLFVSLPLIMDQAMEKEQIERFQKRGFRTSKITEFLSDNPEYQLNIEEIKKVLEGKFYFKEFYV
ncbi:MAG: SDR family NAD(P)-dependent oxidoreductase [Candidatus Hodarchaeales archaeon]|jgi:FlaA1/EpsC-like NDP-sugar epimerase